MVAKGVEIIATHTFFVRAIERGGPSFSPGAAKIISFTTLLSLFCRPFGSNLGPPVWLF